MTFPFYFNLLLRVINLIFILTIALFKFVYIKRKNEDMSEENDEKDETTEDETTEDEITEEEIKEARKEHSNNIGIASHLLANKIGEKIDAKGISSLTSKEFKGFLILKEAHPAFFDDEEEETSSTEAIRQVLAYNYQELRSLPKLPKKASVDEEETSSKKHKSDYTDDPPKAFEFRGEASSSQKAKQLNDQAESSSSNPPTERDADGFVKPFLPKPKKSPVDFVVEKSETDMPSYG